ncbi:MAG: DUF3516 domain-containing protein [Myxococcota bacterium]
MSELAPLAPIDSSDTDSILEHFLNWVKTRRFALYPAQEEAVLELMGEKHVILNTPTGSGKSLVALAMHFRSLCRRERSFYTAPIKALVSEKFFDLCDHFGAAHVGMLTGDASVNANAPIICCTAEILANMALREGRYARVDTAVIDEFHYYGDIDRGMAWQIPLIALQDAKFLLMSATLGDTQEICQQLQSRTHKEVVVVRSTQRPVPLDFEYRQTPLHVTVQSLLEHKKAPIYLVNFTQRDAAEQAQNLISLNVSDKENKRALLESMLGFRFDSPYGKDMRRFVQSGIGLHHAGLLPKYRRLVEQLAQKGLLKVVSGTDTLGVGVNIPIRTVLFSRLCKFDGNKVRILSVRDFQQIAGRAGRKGFDEQGSVVCQAPEHIIENRILQAKAQSDPKRKKKVVLKKPPVKGYVHFDEGTFDKLVSSDPEPLRSTFVIDQGLLMNMIRREVTLGYPDGGYKRLVELIEHSHESLRAQTHHKRHAATLFRSLRESGVVISQRPTADPRHYVTVRDDLQREFSLYQSLSLYLVDTLARLPSDVPHYAYDVLSLVEAVQENPRVLLMRQVDKLKGIKIAELKAQGMEYEERMEELEKVTHPKPLEDFLYLTFDTFRIKRPWLRHENVRPKSIARDMIEKYASFNDYVKLYDLQRSEGILLRYLSQVYKTLLQSVPEEYRTPDVVDIIAYLRVAIAHADSSLVQEWESLVAARQSETPVLPGRIPPVDITRDARAFTARLRAEMHRLVKALAERDYEQALICLRDPCDNDDPWTPERFEQALEPFYDQYTAIVFDHTARLSEHTRLYEEGLRQWRITQTLLDPQGDNIWFAEASVDLADLSNVPEGPLIKLERLGT